MLKPVKFDPQGEKLWINIEMYGIYFITYTYQLWSADAAAPPILTNLIKTGSNEIPHDDFFPVVNDYNVTEPLEKNADRTLTASKMPDITGQHTGTISARPICT